MIKRLLFLTSSLFLMFGLVSVCFAQPSDTVVLLVTVINDTTPPTGSIKINNDQPDTDVTLVELTLTAQDNIGVTQMQFSNDGTNWSSPEDYASSKTWTLSDSSGIKTVYAKFKDAAGNWSNAVSDTINLVNASKERVYIYLNGQRIAMEENGKKYFFHNDHLGGTNVITDESGQQVKYIEYKPYGETKIEEGNLTSKRKFTGKELDDSTGLYDYAARQYYPKIARFISADPLEFSDAGINLAGGKDLQSFLANPQNLNRYTYCSNNPLRYIDPDGLLTILIHGTYSSPEIFKRDFIEKVEKTFNEQHAIIAFEWSGQNIHQARVEAAKNLANIINKYTFAEGEKLNIVAHSHGGNVAFLASQEKLQRKIDALVTLGTPIREYRPNPKNIDKIYNVYSKYDKVQSEWGGGENKLLRHEWGSAGQTLENAQNVHIPVNKGPVGTHGYLYTREAWETYIQKEINKN